jgi:amphi-Trp domain-containing protein
MTHHPAGGVNSHKRPWHTAPPIVEEKQMSNFEVKETEHISRQHAAERLTDVAYALSAGGTVEFMIAGERVALPIGDGVSLKRELKSDGTKIELELELSWSTVHVAPAVPTQVTSDS